MVLRMIVLLKMPGCKGPDVYREAGLYNNVRNINLKLIAGKRGLHMKHYNELSIISRVIKNLVYVLLLNVALIYVSDCFAELNESVHVDLGALNKRSVEPDGKFKTELTLEYVINEAIDNNPLILSSGKRWDAAKKNIKVKTSLDDPTLRFGKINAPGHPFNFGKEAVDDARIMSPTTVSISQKIPFPGKLRLRGKVASEAAAMKKGVLDSRVQKIIEDVKLAYYDLYLLYKSIEINEENRSLLQGFTRIAELRYSVGKVSQRDVLAAMVELSKIVNEITVLKLKKSSSEAQLNNLLNRELDSALGRPQEFEKQRLGFDLSELDKIALENRPALLRSNHAVKKNRYNLELKKKDYFSDFTAMIEYRRIDNFPSDTWSSSLSINIPWLWSKQRYKIKSAKDELKAALADNKAINNQTLFELRDIGSRLIASESTLNLFKTSVIPQAKQALEAARAGYETGGIDFQTLIDSQRTLLNAKLQYYKSLTEYQQNLAKLERVVGIKLTR